MEALGQACNQRVLQRGAKVNEISHFCMLAAANPASTLTGAFLVGGFGLALAASQAADLCGFATSERPFILNELSSSWSSLAVTLDLGYFVFERLRKRRYYARLL